MNINRSTHRKIKKMSRQEFESFLDDLHKEAFNAGVRSSKNVDFRIRLSQTLQKTKGIGPVLHERIMLKAKEME